MAGKERVRDRAELEASNELREATDLAAALIRRVVGKQWNCTVSSTHREYSIRRAPYSVFDSPRAPGRPAVMSRLLARDFREAPPPGTPVFHVLERPPQPVGSEEIRLVDGPKEDLSAAFLPAKDFACMRFWIDMEHELGARLHNSLSAEDRNLLHEYGIRAKTAAASVIETRRVALKMTQQGFADGINVSVDQASGIEGGNIAVTGPLLNRIEVTFARRERTLGFVPQETSPWLARQLAAAAPEPGNGANGSAPLRSTPISSRAYPTLVGLSMLAEPPETENLDHPDWEAGARLREQRKRRNVSIVKFAEAARMTPGHVSRLERGDLKPTPEVEMRMKLARDHLDTRGRSLLA